MPSRIPGLSQRQGQLRQGQGPIRMEQEQYDGMKSSNGMYKTCGKANTPSSYGPVKGVTASLEGKDPVVASLHHPRPWLESIWQPEFIQTCHANGLLSCGWNVVHPSPSSTSELLLSDSASFSSPSTDPDSNINSERRSRTSSRSLSASNLF